MFCLSLFLLLWKGPLVMKLQPLKQTGSRGFPPLTTWSLPDLSSCLSCRSSVCSRTWRRWTLATPLCSASIRPPSAPWRQNCRRWRCPWTSCRSNTHCCWSSNPGWRGKSRNTGGCCKETNLNRRGETCLFHQFKHWKIRDIYKFFFFYRAVIIKETTEEVEGKNPNPSPLHV